MSPRPTRAAVLDTVADLDTLDCPPAVTVTGNMLREGMVLLDPDTDTPAAWLDTKQTAPRGSGSVQFLAHDLDTGALTSVLVRRGKEVAVMADPVHRADPGGAPQCGTPAQGAQVTGYVPWMTCRACLATFPPA